MYIFIRQSGKKQSKSTQALPLRHATNLVKSYSSSPLMMKHCNFIS